MPRINDRGVLIDVITNVDLSGSGVDGVIVSVRYDILKPDQTTDVWSGTSVVSGTGRIRHVSSGNELNMAGEYLVSPFLHFTASKEFHTPGVRFHVTELYVV